MDQVQGGRANHLQVAVGRAGCDIDRSGHLDAQGCRECADHVGLVAGEDRLIADTLGGVANDRRLGRGGLRDRAGFQQLIL